MVVFEGSKIREVNRIEPKKTILLRVEIASRDTNRWGNGGKKIYNCSSTLQSVRAEMVPFCINKTLGVNVFEEKGIIPFLNAILHFLRLSSFSSAFLRDRRPIFKVRFLRETSNVFKEFDVILFFFFLKIRLVS